MSKHARIKDIEDEIGRTQKNKATMGHLCRLKAQLSKLRSEVLDDDKKGPGGGAGERGFDVTKAGDARVGLVGFPSVGKSTLMTSLTGSESEVAGYEFTTLTAIPGTMNYKGCNIQILDLPGIIEGANDNKGRGRQVIGAARTCDVILVVLDASKPIAHKAIIERECEGFGIRINQVPPLIRVKRTKTGGIHISTPVKQTELDDALIKSICREFRLNSAEITLWEDATAEQLIDAIEGNRHYVPAIYVLNMIDKISIEELDVFEKIPGVVPISAKQEWNFDGLMEEVWHTLGLIRIYTKPKGQIPDYEAPVVLPGAKATVENFCKRIHRNLMADFRHAVVWGSSVKFQPQKVGRDHILLDEDVVQIVKRV